MPHEFTVNPNDAVDESYVVAMRRTRRGSSTVEIPANQLPVPEGTMQALSSAVAQVTGTPAVSIEQVTVSAPPEAINSGSASPSAAAKLATINERSIERAESLLCPPPQQLTHHEDFDDDDEESDETKSATPPDPSQP